MSMLSGVLDGDGLSFGEHEVVLHDDKKLTIQKLNKRGEYKGVGKNLVKEQL